MAENRTNHTPGANNNKAYWEALQKNIQEIESRMKFPNRGNPVGNPRPLNINPQAPVQPTIQKKTKDKPAN